MAFAVSATMATCSPERALARADLARRLEAVHFRHVAVHQDQVEYALRVGVHRLAAVARHRDLVAT